MADRQVLAADIVVEDSRWGAVASVVDVCFSTVMNLNIKSFKPGEVALLMTNDENMRALNLTFRQKNQPTNVLSFPAGEALPGMPLGAMQMIGDIALGYETCATEACEKGIAIADHTAHLIFHGILHLFGYDHVQVCEAEKMEELETALLAKMGIANPYAP